MTEHGTVEPAAEEAAPGKSWLTLAAMVFAVAMIFIDQTIVAIAIPDMTKELGLSQTGGQWVITGYLLSLAAFFAFGGRLGDTHGHKRFVTIGIVVFAGASIANGLTPQASYSEAWIVGFRVVQGFGAALMFPAALALVVNSFPLGRRGQANAIFFGIAGGMTAIGPLVGGFLVQIDWRYIFFINVPVAVIGLVLLAIAKPEDDYTKAPIDIVGLLLTAGGMALTIIGFQQASVWGWVSAATIGCIVGGLVLIAVLVWYELRVDEPLIDMRIFEIRMFSVDNLLLFLLMMAFVPMFFFASAYAQVSLGKSATDAGIFLLYFFIGFAVTTQISGKMLDRGGVRVPAILGGAIGAVGFFFWAQNMTDLSVGSQWYWVIVAGAGVGFVLSPASTDALNRAPRLARGEATGIVQTVRNYSSSLAMAVLGTILININTRKVETSLEAAGESPGQATKTAEAFMQSSGGETSALGQVHGEQAREIYEAVSRDFAEASQVIFYIMAGVMVAVFIAALVLAERGKQTEEAPETRAAADRR